MGAEVWRNRIKVKLIHFFSQGSTFSAIYFEKYPNRKSVNVKHKTNILQLSTKKTTRNLDTWTLCKNLG